MRKGVFSRLATFGGDALFLSFLRFSSFFFFIVPRCSLLRLVGRNSGQSADSFPSSLLIDFLAAPHPHFGELLDNPELPLLPPPSFKFLVLFSRPGLDSAPMLSDTVPASPEVIFNHRDLGDLPPPKIAPDVSRFFAFSRSRVMPARVPLPPFSFLESESLLFCRVLKSLQCLFSLLHNRCASPADNCGRMTRDAAP